MVSLKLKKVIGVKLQFEPQDKTKEIPLSTLISLDMDKLPLEQAQPFLSQAEIIHKANKSPPLSRPCQQVLKLTHLTF